MEPDPTEVRHRFSDPDEDEWPKPPPHTEGRKVVGVDGKWYDVTDFLPKHPGGPIIEQYVGQDATHVFQAQGHGDVLKYRKVVGTYTPKTRGPADKDFEELVKFFKKEGFFETDFVWYAKKASFMAALWISAVTCVVAFDAWYMHYLGAVLLAFSWQQTGFIMHDAMHGQLFRHPIKDRATGTFFGTFFFGFSAHWWRDEHIIHHAMTNTVDVATRFADPQMWELSWAQNKVLFPLFSGALQHFFIKIQHITFVPFVVCIGRFEIITDSYRVERRWYEWLAIIGHWTWMCTLLSYLPTWREVFCFYIIAAWTEGVFHFQLILSHYCKKFLNVSDYHKNSWFEFMVLSNMNIEIPWWQDWFYGGLNFHIEHHLFPKMARNKLRTAGKYVKEICDKHNIDYDMCYFSDALTKTLTHLKTTGRHYDLHIDFRS